uniref:Uncharacterized protein n=1 Tax=Arundo donax TaxID=35708 RepID=A0A0A9BEQ2_ARUDO
MGHVRNMCKIVGRHGPEELENDRTRSTIFSVKHNLVSWLRLGKMTTDLMISTKSGLTDCWRKKGLGKAWRSGSLNGAPLGCSDLIDRRELMAATAHYEKRRR